MNIQKVKKYLFFKTAKFRRTKVMLIEGRGFTTGCMKAIYWVQKDLKGVL